MFLQIYACASQNLAFVFITSIKYQLVPYRIDTNLTLMNKIRQLVTQCKFLIPHKFRSINKYTCRYTNATETIVILICALVYCQSHKLQQQNDDGQKDHTCIKITANANTVQYRWCKHFNAFCNYHIPYDFCMFPI